MSHSVQCRPGNADLPANVARAKRQLCRQYDPRPTDQPAFAGARGRPLHFRPSANSDPYAVTGIYSAASVDFTQALFDGSDDGEIPILMHGRLESVQIFAVHFLARRISILKGRPKLDWHQASLGLNCFPKFLSLSRAWRIGNGFAPRAKPLCVKPAFLFWKVCEF